MTHYPRTILVTEVAIAIAVTFGPLLLTIGRLAGYGS
jgi:hypothetical protein